MKTSRVYRGVKNSHYRFKTMKKIFSVHYYLILISKTVKRQKFRNTTMTKTVSLTILTQ